MDAAIATQPATVTIVRTRVKGLLSFMRRPECGPTGAVHLDPSASQDASQPSGVVVDLRLAT